VMRDMYMRIESHERDSQQSPVDLKRDFDACENNVLYL